MSDRSNDPTLQASDSIPHPRLPYAQFASGSVIAGRYRIVSLLGAGGMGEVYRADDMKLGQQVALKFLPASMAQNAIQLDLLHDEVRLGRQVSHPNVCRVYDIGEWEGAHFVAMEYVDGEDLARLLRRIGRLSHDKAVEIARGLAAGLAAAHAKGILHRDLKPANVMIDGRGEPRITDFGLAMTSEESAGSDIVAGTPAYMAPEQLEGKPATVQSDLYALGLVLYEIFTGRHARTGRTVPDLRREHTTQITTPSSVVHDIEPAVERIILRCLEADPANRPRSARQVFEALPGGDPLAAAMAAGETPSPGLVAAAGIEGTLRPAIAWAWLGVIALLLASVVGIASDFRITSKIPFAKSPEVLEANAVDAATAVGIESGPYRTTGIEVSSPYLAWISEHDSSPHRFDHLRSGPPAVVFWLREGNQPLTPYSTLSAASKDDPPLGPDMATIEVDTTGKLVGLAATAKGRRGARADFPKLLRLAGFAASSLKSVPPRAMPQLFADERMAWDGVWPDDRGKPAHIEAAAAGGVPVFLQITGPWDDDQGAVGRQPFSTPVLATFLTALATVLAVLVIILAGRNLRGRRGDRSGATRVAVAVFCLEVCISLLRGDHRAAFSHERSIVASAFGDGLFSAAAFFLLYIALEPYVRRRWPERLIAWSRLLAGNLRNPLVGRDLLIGIAAGLAHATLASLSNWLPGRLGLILPQPPLTGHLDALLGVRHVLRGVLVAAGSGIFIGMGLIVILVVLAIVFRSRPAAAIALFVLQLAGFALAAAHSPYVFAASIVIAVIWTAVTVRVGLLGIATAQTVFGVAFFLPLSVGASSWMLPITMVPILFIAFLAAFAFRTALGGQPMFSANLLDE